MDFLPFDPEADVSRSRRRLPHWFQEGRTYYLTFRLADSLPKSTRKEINEEREKWLIAQGITGQERVLARWEEFTAGTLPIPTGSVNYILTGTGFDSDTGEFEGSYLRWTVYTPNATPESTGISAAFSEGGPWLMFPGTPGSHIMITPPRGGGK